MVAGAAAASRAPADAVTPTSASRRVKVFPMGAVIADGPIRCCGKTRLSGPSLVASYRQILGDKTGAVSHKAVSGQCNVRVGDETASEPERRHHDVGVRLSVCPPSLTSNLLGSHLTVRLVPRSGICDDVRSLAQSHSLTNERTGANLAGVAPDADISEREYSECEY